MTEPPVIPGHVSSTPNSSLRSDARFDAFIHLADPDALAHELTTRNVCFHRALADTADGLRGLEIADADGYVLFFGRPAAQGGR